MTRALTVVLAVTGSIAAYKSPAIARLLKKRGAHVIGVMTNGAQKFLGPATLSGITGEPVHTDMWDASFAGEKHVALADRADVIVIAPATADVIARLAQGRADDLVTALALCAKGPVLVAPAMHPRMWHHPATQANIQSLTSQARVSLVGPVHGEVASGDLGTGRMSEPEDIVRAVWSALAKKDLMGKRVIVTAGPTAEDLDAVRFLTNRSTGKMGFSIAERAAARGADVTLIAGPVSLPTPHLVRRVDVRSALQMKEALWSAAGPKLEAVDAIVMSAAVGDYRFAKVAKGKTKKAAVSTLSLELNPDIIAEVGAARQKGGPRLIAFALETLTGKALIAEARKKLVAKRVDLVVANEAKDSFGKETNRVHLVERSRARSLPEADKADIADAILDTLVG
jgi:phosphopantothenoylcysteine decarboxylase/phosphopantothenate--cysteine ligase